MKLNPKTVAELAISFQPQAYLRVMAIAHAKTPLGMAFGQTRFASPDNSFRLLYIARNLATAIAETIVRDRFEGEAERVVDSTEIEDWAVSEVSAPSPLTVVDLRTTGLLKLGVSTDAARAKEQADGRKLSKARFDHFAIDGVLYLSRLTSAECLAVYDRAVGTKLTSTPAANLARQSELIEALRSIAIGKLLEDLRPIKRRPICRFASARRSMSLSPVVAAVCMASRDSESALNFALARRDWPTTVSKAA